LNTRSWSAPAPLNDCRIRYVVERMFLREFSAEA
jgi:hypothetical protein